MELPQNAIWHQAGQRTFSAPLSSSNQSLRWIYAAADDVLVTGKGKTLSKATNNHDENMITHLKRCQECHKEMNVDKFKCNEVIFIRHLIPPGGIKADS